MKILLTGAAGFTGRHFTESAKVAGHEIIPFRSNLMDYGAVADEVRQVVPEAVVHLGAISFIGHANPNAFYDVNVIGTLNLLEALANAPITARSVLLSSSANIYGNCLASPISEQQQAAPVNHYAMSKLAMEYMARTYSDRLPLFFTRPFNYTGLGQAPSFIIPKLVMHFLERKSVVELGNVDVEREFNDVRFVCDAYLRLLQAGLFNEAVNICSGKPVTLKGVIEMLSQITGHSIEVSVNPAFVRVNEIHRLCGDPAKLIKIIGNVAVPPLADTLTWMLAETPVTKQ